MPEKTQNKLPKKFKAKLPDKEELVELRESCRNLKNRTDVEYLMYMDKWFELLGQGYNALDGAKKFQEFYPEVPLSKAQDLRKIALKQIKDMVLADAEAFREKQINRLDNLLQKAIDKGDLKTANKIMDTMNKTAGLYRDTNVTVAPVLQFQFGDEPAPMKIITTVTGDESEDNDD